MRLFNQEFGKQTLDRIRRTIEANAENLSRTSLSRQVCEWLNWRSPNGKLRELSCRKALLKLEEVGEIVLPASRGQPGWNLSKDSSGEVMFEGVRMTGTLLTRQLFIDTCRSVNRH